MTALVTPRKQPPVAIELRPDRPERLSFTWLSRFVSCKHSALLHLRYGGGAGSGEMDRGSLVHDVIARLTNECMEQAEVTIPPELAKAVLFEAYADPRYTVPAEQWDYARQCVYHWAKYTVLDLATILGVEQLLVWDVGDWRISGKFDFAWLDGDTLGVIDYKTARWPQTQAEFAESLQVKLYALMAVYGRPVTVRRCATCDGDGTRLTNMGDEIWRCPDCNARGHTETVEDFPLGGAAQKFHMVESYPGVIWGKDEPNERIATREHTFTRADLVDEKSQVESLLAQVTEVFETGQWDAVPGDDQCGKCPARAECPLPALLLPAPGEITTPEEAEHFTMAQFFLEAEKKDTDKALKAWNKEIGEPVPLGDGLELDVAPEKKTSIQRDQLSADIEAGQVKPLDEYIETTFSNSFRRRKVGKAAELRAAKDSFDEPTENDGAGVSTPLPASSASANTPGARWGEETPF